MKDNWISVEERLPDVLSLSDAKNLAISDGKKICHEYFMPHEYLIFKEGKWLTEEGYEVPYHYWIGLVPEMLTGWSEYIEPPIST